MTCPFSGFVGHQEQEKRRRKRPKEDEGQEEEREPVQIPIHIPDPIGVPEKTREQPVPEPPALPPPIPVLPPAPFLPPVRVPLPRKPVPRKPGVNGNKPDMRPEKLPEKELEPARNIGKMIEDAERSVPGKLPFIPAMKRRLLESGERIRLPEIPDIPDPPFRPPRVPRHPIPAFDPSVEGVPSRMKETPNIRRAFAEEAVTQEFERRVPAPNPSGLRMQRGLVAGALAGAALGAGGFAFNAARRMRGLMGRGPVFGD